MRRSPAAVLTAAALAVLSAAPPATAGPIAPPPPQPPVLGGFQVDVLPTGPDGLYLGRFDYWDRDAVSEVHAYGQAPGGQSGTLADGEEVRLLGASKGGYTLRDAPPVGPGAGNTFRARVTVTDYESGQTGSAEFTGTGSLLTTLPESLYSEFLIHASGEVAVTAGRNVFTFDLADGDTDSSAWVFAAVTVTPVAAPEPGTFALAGLGIAVVGLRARPRLTRVTAA